MITSMFRILGCLAMGVGVFVGMDGVGVRGVGAEVSDFSDDKGNPAMAVVEDRVGLPRVLLIGDSISIGYTLPVRERLAGVATVHRIMENGGATTNGLAKLEKWLGNGKWDVIHFNWGLHDMKLEPDGRRWVPPAEYEANLRVLAGRLKKTGAKLVFATTTPVPVGVKGVRRDAGDPDIYNRAAWRVMGEFGVAVNDLNGFVKRGPASMQIAENVHFTREGSAALAGPVVASIREQLGLGLPEMASVRMRGDETGWRAIGAGEWVNVNCASNTWTFDGDRIFCTGQPVGVIRSRQLVTNVEVLVEWRHLKAGGNSGVFLWATPESIRALESGKGRLPAGIEVQVLDHGYTEQYERQYKKAADWFTSHGDVFPTQNARMTPFSPVSPDGSRSYPRKRVSRGVGEWNHYYVRAINGEVRLWVNGEEVSGGTRCVPAWGYMCLESEGSPIEFRNIRIRELP